jgi:hypothetical protein
MIIAYDCKECIETKLPDVGVYFVNKIDRDLKISSRYRKPGDRGSIVIKGLYLNFVRTAAIRFTIISSLTLSMGREGVNRRQFSFAVMIRARNADRCCQEGKKQDYGCSQLHV